MSSKMRSGKAVWIVAAAVIIAALLLVVLFVTQSASDRQESIVLPAAPGEVQEDPGETGVSDGQNDHFVAVTNDNVASVFQTLSRPAAYSQSYTVTVGSGSNQRTREVSLWSNGALLHAEVADGSQTQTLITDGKEVYLWYGDGTSHISLTLPQGVTAEDVLGLPDFNAYLKISVEDVVTSDYQFLEEPQVQCIYVCLRDETGTVTQHWVNLENGLLYRSDVQEDDALVYSVVQTGFELLAEEDEGFSDRFILPDGTNPFIVKTEELPQ